MRRFLEDSSAPGTYLNSSGVCRTGRAGFCEDGAAETWVFLGEWRGVVAAQSLYARPARLGIAGAGLDYASSGYRCVFTAGGVVVETVAAAVNTTVVECASPTWVGPPGDVTLALVLDGAAVRP